MSEETKHICPGCGTTMWGSHCKLRCPKCGFFEDCSDGVGANLNFESKQKDD